MTNLSKVLLSGKRFLQRAGGPASALLLAGGMTVKADIISSNLSNATAGTEVASGDTWLTASFGTGTSSDTLSSVTLLLSHPISGVAEVDLYSTNLLEPGSLVATLTSPATYASSLSNSTFLSSGVTLSANSTYWIVLKALSGEFDWGWTADNSGTGTGFQGTWGLSTDTGSTWYTYAVYPTQLSVITTATPEPSTGWLGVAGLLVGAMVLYRRQRT